jgi:hypothetical protein
VRPQNFICFPSACWIGRFVFSSWDRSCDNPGVPLSEWSTAKIKNRTFMFVELSLSRLADDKVLVAGSNELKIGFAS